MDNITFDVARQAATLVSPDILDLETLVPTPPDETARIVFLTDTRSVKQCSSCVEEPMLAVDTMQNEVLRLYGITAGGVINSSRLSSYSLETIASILEGGEGDGELESALRNATWIVINMLDANPDERHTEILRGFLSERQDLLRSKFVILFAFDAPYYLDSTDISKISAYYCLFSKASPFLEVAVRILFQELSTEGALPVSVPGVGYDLFSALAPDPEQVITLFLESPFIATITEEGATEVGTPIATFTPEYRVGDSIIVRTGILLDRNGNPVPDGTQVQFTLSMNDNTVLLQSVDATTTDGYARASFQIDTPGLLEIRATSEPATISVTLQMDVSGEGFSITILAPTPEIYPTATPENTQNATERIVPIDHGKPGFIGWLIMVLVLFTSTTLVISSTRKNESLRWRWRWVLCTTGGILVSYLYLALQLPGAAYLLMNTRYSGVIGVVMIGAVLGISSGFAWWRINER